MKDNETLDISKTDDVSDETRLQKLESTDLSSVFFSQYNTTQPPLENKKSAGIIENFVIFFQNSLSAFLGRKIDFHFDEMKVCELKEFNLDKIPVVLSSIQFSPQNQLGLVFFNYAFMHFVIDILYGASNYKNDTMITSLGKSSITIAEKVTSLCLAALQEAISEYHPMQLGLLKTTEHRSLILNQPLPDQFVHLTFHATLNGVACPLHIAIPDAVFDEITFQEGTQPIENMNNTVVNDTLKKDIIDSTITLIATLQDIKLKITDIMNLKTGDLIPIQDPTIVFMAHDQKKIFRGTVGQANSQRVVKIIDTL